MKVNGTSIGKASGYTFENVTGNQSIQAEFKKRVYTITPIQSSGGEIDPAGAVKIECGGSVSFSFVPNTGYSVEDVLLDGRSIGIMTEYTFQDVQADHSIRVVFGKIDHLIKAKAKGTGTIFPYEHKCQLDRCQPTDRTPQHAILDHHFVKVASR